MGAVGALSVRGGTSSTALLPNTARSRYTAPTAQIPRVVAVRFGRSPVDVRASGKWAPWQCRNRDRASPFRVHVQRQHRRPRPNSTPRSSFARTNTAVPRLSWPNADAISFFATVAPRSSASVVANRPESDLRARSCTDRDHRHRVAFGHCFWTGNLKFVRLADFFRRTSAPLCGRAAWHRARPR